MKKKNPFAYQKTKHPGVYFINGTDPRGKQARIFYVVYRVDGKQHHDSVGFEGEMVLVEKELKKLSATVAAGIRFDKIRKKELPNKQRREAERAEKAAHDSRDTIGRIAEKYFTHRDRQKNVKGDRNLYKRYLSTAEELKDKIPEEVDPFSLDRFRKRLSQQKSKRGEKKPLSPTTIRNTMALLRQIVNFGIGRGLTKGFSGAVPVPRVKASLKGDDLSPAHLSALLVALDTSTDQNAADVIRLALFTGARREEILSLRWPDVDLTRGLWTLRDRKAGGDTGFPLSAPALEVLTKRHGARPLDEKGEEVSKFVFPGTGKRGYLRDPRRGFERIKAAAKLPATFRPLHDYRHHYATMMVAEGVDLLTVARLIGHADAQMVMRRYAHVRPGVLADAAALSGRLIEQTAAKERKEQAEKAEGGR